jgi:hypothetical protein
LDRVDQLILLERYLINSCNNIDLVRMGLIAPTTPTSKHKATNPEADSAKENVAKNSVREDYDSDGNRHELDLDIKLENIIQEVNLLHSN